MNVKTRTAGMLFDTYMLAAVEQAIEDKVSYAGENKEAVLATALASISCEDLKASLGYIIDLCIERAVCSLSRQAAIFSKTPEELAIDINEFNARRTESVRAIDAITNPDDLTFSPKTYTSQFVSQIRTNGILVDDYISSYIKFHLNANNGELETRIEALKGYLGQALADNFSPELAVELINLAVSATMCFFTNEVSYSGTDSDIVQAAKDVVMTNKGRRSAMKAINALTGEADE